MSSEEGLFRWYVRQLTRLRADQLDDESKAKLQSLVPDLSESTKPVNLSSWRQAWENYQQVYGDGTTAVEKQPEDSPPRKSADSWANRQCRLRRKEKLEAWKIALLDGIGFDWNRTAQNERMHARWYAKLEQLRAMEAEHGKPLPVKIAMDSKLHPWISRMRQLYSKGELPSELIRDFEEKGFIFDGRAAHKKRLDREWKQHYRRLEAFHKRFGHARIPATYAEDPELGGWLAHQRERMAKGKMKPDKLRALEKLGVDPMRPDGRRTRKDIRLSPWQKRYGQLQQLAASRPDRAIPPERELSVKTRSWLIWQRNYYAEGRLDPWQVDALRKIGFDPAHVPEHTPQQEKNRDRWLANVERMKAFVAKYGHGSVPDKHPDGLLIGFILRARRRYRHGELDAQQIQELRDAGFVFDPSKAPSFAWMAQLDKLRAYHAEHGTCVIPRQYPPDQGLAEFVAQQKQRGRLGKLNAEHIRLLDELDFPWSGNHPQPREDKS